MADAMVGSSSTINTRGGMVRDPKAPRQDKVGT
jgi:hypothetical protein